MEADPPVQAVCTAGSTQAVQAWGTLLLCWLAVRCREGEGLGAGPWGNREWCAWLGGWSHPLPSPGLLLVMGSGRLDALLLLLGRGA